MFEKRNIVVADTIGLCSTQMDDKTVIDSIWHTTCLPMKSIDAVFMVFRADRLLPNHVESIKNVLNKLHYHRDENHLRFWFFATFADHLSPHQREQLRTEARAILNLRDTIRYNRETGEGFRTLTFSGFAAEETLNDYSRAMVQSSLQEVDTVLSVPPVGDPLSVNDEKGGFCIIG